MKIKLLVEGGNMTPGPAVGQQLGPLGINIGKVISDVNNATSSFKGMKVPVELDIDTKTKDFKVKVSSPPVSELLKKELGLEKGSGEPNKKRIGNIAIEQIIKIAKIKSPNMIVSDFKSAVKSVVGSCVSLGVFIDNKKPKQVEEEIDNGHYDKEISSQITELSPEKKEKLIKFFEKVKTKQDKIAAEKAAKEAEEAAKAEKAAKESAAEETGEAKKPEKPEEPKESEEPQESKK